MTWALFVCDMANSKGLDRLIVLIVTNIIRTFISYSLSRTIAQSFILYHMILYHVLSHPIISNSLQFYYLISFYIISCNVVTIIQYCINLPYIVLYCVISIYTLSNLNTYCMPVCGPTGQRGPHRTAYYHYIRWLLFTNCTTNSLNIFFLIYWFME